MFVRAILVSAVCGVFLLSSLPAMAEPVVTTISGDDQHLYINVASEQVTRVSTDLKNGKIGVFSGEETETYFSKGKIRISSGRFFELLEEAGAAPAFRERVYAKRADRNFWGLTTLGGLAVGVGGLALGYNLSFARGMGALSGISTAVGVGGLATGTLGGLVWTFKAAGSDYSWEQANDAVVDYNKRLDARPKP